MQSSMGGKTEIHEMWISHAAEASDCCTHPLATTKPETRTIKKRTCTVVYRSIMTPRNTAYNHKRKYIKTSICAAYQLQLCSWVLGNEVNNEMLWEGWRKQFSENGRVAYTALLRQTSLDWHDKILSYTYDRLYEYMQGLGEGSYRRKESWKIELGGGGGEKTRSRYQGDRLWERDVDSASTRLCPTANLGTCGV